MKEIKKQNKSDRDGKQKEGSVVKGVEQQSQEVDSNGMKSERSSNHVQDIIQNYFTMEKNLVTELLYKIDNHHGTTGSNREYIWKELFKRIVPKKFKISQSVFIIDSLGNCSKEVDLAIYDEQYTPYIFRYKKFKFIPIEAVACGSMQKSRFR